MNKLLVLVIIFFILFSVGCQFKKNDTIDDKIKQN